MLAAGAAATILALGSPTGLDSVAKVGGLIVGLTPLILGLIYWARRSPHRPQVASSPAQVSAAQRQLCDLVLAQWRTEIVVRQLDDPAPLAVRWRLTELDVNGDVEQVARPKLLRYLIGQGTRRFEGRTDRISEMASEFRKLPRRRLVILGDPGMGKTTLAVLLLRELLMYPHGEEPVPVFFSMSGWDPSAESLHTWVARRLTEDYPALRAPDFGPDAPRALVNQRRILPILDGLDELPEQARPAILDQLNAAAADPLILTCRTAEYETALADQGRRGLTSAAVIEPNQLKAADAAAYLERNLPPTVTSGWAELLTALRVHEHSPISQALSSPLTLWLLRKVYVEPRADPAALCDTSRFATADALTEHLLDHLVEALITANPPRPDTDDEHPFVPRHTWEPSDAKTWLAFLAHHLNMINSRDLAWWQLSLAVPRPIKAVIALGIGLALMCAFMFSFGLVLGSAFGFTFGPAFVLVGGVAFAILGRSSITEPAYADLRLRGRMRLLWRKLTLWSSIRAGLLFGLVVGFLFGLIVGFDSGLVDGLAAGLVGGLAFGLIFGLAFGFVLWAKTPLVNDGPQTPTVTFRRDTKLLYLYSLVFGVGFAFVGLVFGLGFVFEFELAALVGLGFVFGLAAGFAFGLGQSSGKYLVAIVVLRAKGCPSLRLLTFLDDAHRVGILREAGAVYQFRHAKLQDRLAATYTMRA
ncbi:NACHT domain-containing protein [Amycolatopsis sp. NPDC058278]|uniref:NACHT domain-containing protein n=1 Tax=Amycolatopsis sp. NPDC058278 TaxID=3346417 RepID=UPI0036DA5FC9